MVGEDVSGVTYLLSDRGGWHSGIKADWSRCKEDDYSSVLVDIFHAIEWKGSKSASRVN
jgi:hypothetical protein